MLLSRGVVDCAKIKKVVVVGVGNRRLLQTSFFFAVLVECRVAGHRRMDLLTRVSGEALLFLALLKKK